MSILPLTPGASMGFSQGDDGDGYRTLGQYFSAMPSLLLIRICYRMAVPDNSCTPMACGQAIDRRAVPSRDESPKLRISFVWFVGLNYPQTRVEHRKTPCP